MELMPKFVFSKKLKSLNTLFSLKNAPGFTLIELLVVISIITILSMIGLVSYQQLVVKSRDAKRKQDLAQMQGYLEQYRNDAFTYPATLNFGTSASPASLSNVINGVTRVYVKTIPLDPLNTGNNVYYYTATCSSGICTDYCLYANLEGSSACNVSTCPTNPGNGVTYNYCVAKP